MRINLKTQNLNRFLPYILIIFSFFTFLNTYNFAFVYDDIYQVVNNKLLSNEVNFFENINNIFTSKTFPGEQYRPIITLSYYLQFISHGLNSSYFHLFNIIFHSINSVLVYFFINFILNNSKVAFFSSLIFAIHPLQVESVASIVGRTEILACFFSISALLLSLREQRRYLSIICCYILACLSKESAFTLLFILPLFSYFFSNAKNNKAYWYFLYLLLTTVLLFIIRAIILADEFLIIPPKGIYFSENPLYHTDIIQRVFPVFQIFGKYIFLFFLPLYLKVDYSLNYIDFFESIYSIQGLFLSFITCIYFYLLIKLKKDKEVLFLLFFGLSFGVTINFLTPIGVYFAERLIYFPIIGLSSFFILLVFKQFKEKIALIFISTFIMLLIIRTLYRIPIWKTNATLFKSMQADNPRSARANLSYGMYLNNIEKDYAKAKKYFLIGHKLEPRMTENARYLSDIAIKKRKFKEAKFWLKKVLVFEPNDKKIIKRIELINQVLASTN